MIVRWQKFIVLGGLISAVLLFGAVAQANTLTFDGNNCTNAGNLCGTTGNINQGYGDISGQLNVVYTSRVAPGNSGTDASSLRPWDVGYNELTNVLYAKNPGNVAEIALQHMAGYTVTLNSFDLGAYEYNQLNSKYTIYDGAYRELFSSGIIPVGTVGSGPTVPGQSSHFTFDLTSANGLIIQWGPDGYDVGIDNLDFTVKAVPEPSTMLFLATGLAGILGYGWRRKRA